MSEHRPDPSDRDHCVCGGAIIFFDFEPHGEGCEMDHRPFVVEEPESFDPDVDEGYRCPECSVVYQTEEMAEGCLIGHDEARAGV